MHQNNHSFGQDFLLWHIENNLKMTSGKLKDTF